MSNREKTARERVAVLENEQENFEFDLKIKY